MQQGRFRRTGMMKHHPRAQRCSSVAILITGSWVCFGKHPWVNSQKRQRFYKFFESIRCAEHRTSSMPNRATDRRSQRLQNSEACLLLDPVGRLRMLWTVWPARDGSANFAFLEGFLLRVKRHNSSFGQRGLRFFGPRGPQRYVPIHTEILREKSHAIA